MLGAWQYGQFVFIEQGFFEHGILKREFVEQFEIVQLEVIFNQLGKQQRHC